MGNLSGKQSNSLVKAAFLDECLTASEYDDDDDDDDAYGSICHNTHARYRNLKWSQGKSLRSFNCIFPEANYTRCRDFLTFQLFNYFFM